jgi:hypothetical protein
MVSRVIGLARSTSNACQLRQVRGTTPPDKQSPMILSTRSIDVVRWRRKRREWDFHWPERDCKSSLYVCNSNAVARSSTPLVAVVHTGSQRSEISASALHLEAMTRQFSLSLRQEMIARLTAPNAYRDSSATHEVYNSGLQATPLSPPGHVE